MSKSDWRCHAARDFAIEDRAWDAKAASRRLFGVGLAAANRGHLAHDWLKIGYPDAYVVPFADVIDGKIVAIKAGLVAAAARLIEIPDDNARSQARAVIDHYLGSATPMPAVKAVTPTPPRSAPVAAASASPPSAPSVTDYEQGSAAARSLISGVGTVDAEAAKFTEGAATARSLLGKAGLSGVADAAKYDEAAATARALLSGNTNVSAVDKAAYDSAAATARALLAKAGSGTAASKYDEGAATARALLGKTTGSEPARAT